MTNREALLRTVLDQPGDPSPRMILADCLEEEGLSHLADVLRYKECCILINSNHGVEVFAADRTERRVYSLGVLPQDCWPRCACGRLADEVHKGHWRAFSHNCHKDEAERLYRAVLLIKAKKYTLTASKHIP